MRRHDFSLGARGLAAVVLLVTLGSGCEPLRKKFVREQKADAAKEVDVILDPVEYAPRSQDPAKEYRYYYGLWLVWHKDLLTSVEENASNKRLTSMSDELLTLMDKMLPLLTGDPAARLNSYRQQLAGWRSVMDQPEAMRDNRQLESNLERLGRGMRRELGFDDVADDVVTSTPDAGSDGETADVL